MNTQNDVQPSAASGRHAPHLHGGHCLREAAKRGAIARQRVQELSKRLRESGKDASYADHLVAALEELLQEARDTDCPTPDKASVATPNPLRFRRKLAAALLTIGALVAIGVAMTAYAKSVRTKFVPHLAGVSSCAG